MHLASTSPREANLCPARAHFCASSTLGKTPPLFDEVVGGRRPCGVGINLVTGVPGGWVQYIFLAQRVGRERQALKDAFAELCGSKLSLEMLHHNFRFC